MMAAKKRRKTRCKLMFCSSQMDRSSTGTVRPFDSRCLRYSYDNCFKVSVGAGHRSLLRSYSKNSWLWTHSIVSRMSQLDFLNSTSRLPIGHSCLRCIRLQCTVGVVGTPIGGPMGTRIHCNPTRPFLVKLVCFLRDVILRK